ncbi:MAG: flagellar brake protein [Pseudomonadales bacterium]|nr:flagellar brake protein [Pseudomonadales bacterium]
MEESDDIVVNETRKAQILKGLAASRTLLQLQLPDRKSTVSTTLLDLTNDSIILDETVHAGMEEPMKVGSRFSATSKVKGIPVNFRSEVKHIGVGKGGIYFVCSMPDYLQYSQKRTSYRLSMATTERPAIRLVDGERSFEGTANDISEGGAKLILPADPALTSGEEMPECQIILTEGLVLSTEARICHIRNDSRRGRAEVGIQFLTLSPRDRTHLRDWIFACERKRLRSR